MEFRLLGPLEVVDDGRSLPLGGPKQRSLLAILLLHAGRVVATERLIDELWGESPPATVAKSIQAYVSRLRKEIGEHRLLTRPPGYVMDVAADQLDLAGFKQLVSEARGADPEGAARLLREAIALWRGPPLADLAYEPFAQAHIARLEELRLTALEERIDADLQTGHHAELTGELEALVAEQPLRERLRAQLMLALYRSGRQAEALATYQRARSALVDELGIEPGRGLRELQQAILEQDLGLEHAASAPAITGTLQGTFVGREHELAELVTGLDEAFAGRGRLFLLVGEPGIGKSRLAEELGRRARARGATVLIGRCWEAGGAPAYWPWVQALRTYVRDSEAVALRSQLAAGAADLATILPDLRRHLPDLPEPRPLESAGARFRLFDATAEFLRNIAADHPIVLVIDDLHAADAPSLLLLQFLARELGATRILLLAAYRDVDPTPAGPLTEMLGELAREPVTRRLPLAGLSESEIAQYIAQTASEIASPELVGELHEETEGNPLFVGEIVRLLSVERARSGSTAHVRLVIPQSVRDVIARRLTHLSEECNRVLTLASVIGREFALDALARLAGVSEYDLLDVLDEAMGSGVLSDAPGAPDGLRFAHVLIRDSLYEGLTSARRLRLHRLVVETLEALYGVEPGPHLAELAHHSIAGRDPVKGLRYAWRAGDRAAALLAYEEAARLYATALRALDLAAEQDEMKRCELLLSAGAAHVRAGNTHVARAAFADAAAIARRLGPGRNLARAARGYGGEDMYLRTGDDERLVPLLEEGLAALTAEDVELRAWLLSRLAGALRDEPQRDRRELLSREAVELARRADNPAALAYALDGRIPAILAPDTLAECLALATELLDVAERIGDTERVLHGHLHRLIVLVMGGDVSQLEAGFDATSRMAEELRQPFQLWEVRAAEAAVALFEGRFTEAEQLIPEAFALGERAKPENANPSYQLQRYLLSDFRGGLEEIEPAMRDLVAKHPARPAFRCALAHLHARLGRAADARRALDDLTRDDCSALPFDQEWLYGMSLLAETSALLRDRDSAPVLYRLLEPWANLNAADWPEGIRGSVARYLAILAATTERWDAAELHFEQALATNASMGARPWLAHTQRDYAGMLLARARLEDRERARVLLDDALVTYRELGMGTHTATACASTHTRARA